MNYPLKHYVSRNPLNAIIAKNMIKVSLLEEGIAPFEYKARFCFSSAYEICKILVEDSPVEVWRLPDLYKKAKFSNSKGDIDTIIQAVTLSIVHILTEHLPQEWKSENQEILDEIFDKINHLYLSDETMHLPGGREMLKPLGARPASVSAYHTLRKDTDIDFVIPFEEFIYQGTRIIDVDETTDEEVKDEWKKALANAQAEIEAKIPQFVYDKQNEGLRIVLGGDKKGVDFSEKEYKKQIEELKTEVDSLQSENLELKKEAEHYKSLYEVADEQLKRYKEEFVPLDEMDKFDWHEQFIIKERIIFFQALTGCNLNEKEKKYANQTQKALLIARFSGNDSNKIRSVINEMSGEIEAVEKGELQEFSEGIRTAALNVYNFLHKAVKGDTFGSKPFQCRQAMENIDKIYHLKLEGKRHLPPPRDNNFLVEPKPEE